MTDRIKDIFEEAATILAYVKKLRDAQNAARAPLSADERANELRASLITYAVVRDRPLLARGEPPLDADAARAFSCGVRFWAQRAAPSLNYGEWDRMVQNAREAVPDFPGDPIRFFETAFEMLRLRDGFLVLP